ncbi:hypothetical protein HZA57_10085 [Candidatus Poribacteria bacterium]|nr:hypothetical protein [Candidatus Poribacteria bacterium]
MSVDNCGFEMVDINGERAMRQVALWNPWGCDKASSIWCSSGAPLPFHGKRAGVKALGRTPAGGNANAIGRQQEFNPT